MDTFVAQLEDTLKQTLAPDSAAIKQASLRLSKELYPNELALPALIHILQNSPSDQIKQLASVEARKLVITKWDSLSALQKPQVRESMLQNTFTQPSTLIRHSSARVVAAFGESDLDKGEWPELLPNLVKAIQEGDAQTKEMAVYTLFTLLETQVAALIPHVPDFLQLFGSLLTDSSTNIRVNAVLALDVISQLLELDLNDVLAAKFKALVPAMMDVLKLVVQADNDEQAKLVFNVFNDFVYLDSSMVGDHLIDLVHLAGEIAANTHIDDEYRSFGLQFLTSCVSVRKSKITSAKLGPQITAVACKIASEEVDVEEELGTEDDENENEENVPSSLALRLMAILAAELPPTQVLVPMFENLSGMLSSSNQFERRAGLLCMGVGSTGAPDFYLSQIHKIVPALVSGLKDDQWIVKVAALRTLSQLTTELQDGIADFHEQLLPLIIASIDSATSVRAYKYACFALDGLIEFMSHDAIGQYLEPLMNKLFHMLQQANSSTLKAAIVSAIGSTAFAGGKAFTPYFTNSVQYLEPFIANAADTEGMSEDDIELRALTFENISTMARAVGSQSFASYAKPLIEAAYGSLSSEHSRIRESGFAFITNMAKVYGAELAGFLDQIVPEILKCLEQEEFTFDGLNEEEEIGAEDDEEDLENKFNVHTGITIEKEIASVALGELATGTGREFARFVEPSLKTLADQIDNSYGMREAAMNAMWKIARAMYVATVGEDFKAPKGVPQQAYVDASVVQLVQTVKKIALANLEEEFELTMVACILDNFSDAIHAMGAVAVVDSASDTSALEMLCVQLMNIIKKEHPCQAEDDEGPADEEDASETEALLYESALEVLISLSSALAGDFNKIFGSFKDVVLANVNAKSKNKRVSSIGALAEISSELKDANPASEQLLTVFVDKLANDKSLEVKGNAAYGVGIVIENSSSDFTSGFNNILQLLFQLLTKTDKRATSADDEEAKDVVHRSYANACGCVARMALKSPQSVPMNHVLGPLLTHMPLETAFEENEPIFKLILHLYESSNELIVNETQKVVDIFAQVFTKEAKRIKLADEATLGREENMDRLKQFASDDLKAKVVELLKFLDGKFAGVVSSNEVLKGVVN